MGKKTFLLGESYTLADVVVWSVVATSPKLRTNFVGDQLAGKWFSRLAALPEFSQAAQKLNVSLKAESKQTEKQTASQKKAAAPIVMESSGFGHFKIHIAEKMALLSDYTVEQFYSLLEAPKVAEHGDLAIPVPSLSKFKKVAGNPAALATEWAAKVTPAISQSY